MNHTCPQGVEQVSTPSSSSRKVTGCISVGEIGKQAVCTLRHIAGEISANQLWMRCAKNLGFLRHKEMRHVTSSRLKQRTFLLDQASGFCSRSRTTFPLHDAASAFRPTP